MLKKEEFKEGISKFSHTLIMMLINTEENRELVKRSPHKDFLDLSIIYRCMVSSEDNQLGTILVDYDFMKLLKINEEELYETARQNTKKLLPIKVKKLDDIVSEMLEQGIKEESDLYVISNDIGMNGAVCITYEEELYNLSQKLDSDLYILPSSIHEVIVLPSRPEDKLWLKELVRNVNEEQVSKEERLSYNIYYYERKNRKILIA